MADLRHDAAATPEQIANDQAAAAATVTCPHCGATVPAGFRFCGACGRPLTPTAPDTQGGDGEAVAAIQQERRVVSVVVADLVGSTALASSLDPEDLHRTLAPFLDGMAEAISAHGGTMQKFAGDAVVGVFGAPVTLGEDPVRAVRAALAMQRRLARLNADRSEAARLAMRVGVATGEALTAADDADLGRAMGEAFNLAARLQAAAPPGEVAVDQRTWRDTRHRLPYQAAGEPWPLRGFAEPVPVMLARAGDPEIGGGMPLLGRDAELRALQDALRRTVETRDPHLVTVAGPPGIGKSRLTRHFTAEAVAAAPAQVRVLSGRCLPYGDGLALWPLAEILRADLGLRLGGPQEAVAGRAREALRRRLPPTDDDIDLVGVLLSSVGLPDNRGGIPTVHAASRPVLQRLIGRVWRRYLDTLVPDGGLILDIEDLHWAGRELLDVLDEIVAAPGTPLLVLATARPDLRQRRPGWGHGPNGTWLDLPPLGDADTAELIEQQAGGRLPPDVIARVRERAEGNPFFAEQLVQMLREEGMLVRRPGGRWQVERALSERLPDTVQAAIGARLDLLSLSERAVVRYAAVMGRSWWARAVAHLSGRDIDDDIDRLIAAGIVFEQEHTDMEGERQLAFQHALTRDVAYSRIPRTTRRTLHAQVGTWIEEHATGRETELAEILTHHFALAGDRLREARYALLAAERKLSGFAAEEAIGWCDRVSSAVTALGAAEGRELRREAALLCGAAREQRGEFPAAEADYRTALEAAGSNEGQRAEALTALAHVLWLQDDYPRAEAELRTARQAALRAGRPELIGKLRYTEGTIAFGQGRYRDAVRTQRAALIAAREAGASDLEALALHGLAEAMSFCGPLPEALEHVQACSALLRRLGWLPMLYHNEAHRGWILQWMGRYEEAEQAQYGAATGALQLGDARNASIAEAGRGYARFLLGDVKGARRNLRVAVELAGQVGAPRCMLVANTHQLELLAEQGEWERLRAVLNRCWQDSDAIGGRFFRAALFAMEGWMALQAGDADAAERWFAGSYEVSERTPTEYVWCLMIELRARDGTAAAERFRRLAAEFRVREGAVGLKARALGDYAALLAGTLQGQPAGTDAPAWANALEPLLPATFRWRLWRTVTRACELAGEHAEAEQARERQQRERAALERALAAGAR